MCPAHTLVPDPSPSRLWRFPSVPAGLRSWQLLGWNVTCGAGRAQVTVVLQQNTQCWSSEAHSGENSSENTAGQQSSGRLR